MDTNQKYGVYNYIDTPDLNMNELVSQVRQTLKGKQGAGFAFRIGLGCFWATLQMLLLRSVAVIYQ